MGESQQSHSTCCNGSLFISHIPHIPLTYCSLSTLPLYMLHISPAASCKDGLDATDRLSLFSYQERCIAEFRHVGEKLEIVGQTGSVLKPRSSERERERGGDGGRGEISIIDYWLIYWDSQLREDISLIGTL